MVTSAGAQMRHAVYPARPLTPRRAGRAAPAATANCTVKRLGMADMWAKEAISALVLLPGALSARWAGVEAHGDDPVRDGPCSELHRLQSSERGHQDVVVHHEGGWGQTMRDICSAVTAAAAVVLAVAGRLT